MLSQVSTEAMNAATYVENYLDCVENFPDELQRLISRMRELDVCFLAKVKEASYWKKQADDNPRQKQKCYTRMQQALSTAQEIGDEKMSVVQTINDKIELRYRSLDTDFRNLDIGKEEQAPAESKDVLVPTTSTSTNNSISIMERPTKRARRGGRSENLSISESNPNESAIAEAPTKNPTPSTSNTTQKKTTTGKKKKRKSRQNVQVQREDNSPKEEVEEPLIDPDEPTYCLCDQISYGEMIMCDNDLCPIEWFHFSCVSLTTKPKGKWYCPKCRGDRPNVMKPKAQFLRELEKYNKEKEEKT